MIRNICGACCEKIESEDGGHDWNHAGGIKAASCGTGDGAAAHPVSSFNVGDLVVVPSDRAVVGEVLWESDSDIGRGAWGDTQGLVPVRWNGTFLDGDDYEGWMDPTLLEVVRRQGE